MAARKITLNLRFKLISAGLEFAVVLFSAMLMASFQGLGIEYMRKEWVSIVLDYSWEGLCVSAPVLLDLKYYICGKIHNVACRGFKWRFIVNTFPWCLLMVALLNYRRCSDGYVNSHNNTNHNNHNNNSSQCKFRSILDLGKDK